MNRACLGDNVRRIAVAIAFVALCMFACCFVFAGVPSQAFAADASSGQGVDGGAGNGDAGDEEETPVEKAKRLIALLPGEVDEVSEADRAAIEEAAEAYDVLSKEEQAELDKPGSDPGAERGYGRWLESSQWALEALADIDGSIPLEDGDYSAYVKSSSSMGKSPPGGRIRKWEVVKFVVVDGQGVATVQGNASSYVKVRVGGHDVETYIGDGGLCFDSSIVMNGTTSFIGIASDAAVAYQITATIPLQLASAAEISSAQETAQEALSSASEKYVAADAALVEEAAQALADRAGKTGVTVIELDAATKELNAVKAAANVLVPEPESGSSSSSGSSSKPKNTQKSSGSASKPSSSSNSSDPPGSGSQVPSGAAGAVAQPQGSTGTGKSVSLPAGTNAAAKTASGASASKSAASASSKGAASTSKGGGLDSATTTASSSSRDDASAEARASEIEKAAKAATWSQVIVVGLFVSLLLAGMCLRTFLFARAKEVS